jgi:short-subunit dehydrogenase
MTYVIVGGSSGVGRALAETFASAGCSLILLSQDSRDTQAIASHLHLTYGIQASSLAFDMSKQDLNYDLIESLLTSHPRLKGILIPAGMIDDSDQIGSSESKIEVLTRVNYLSPCKIINHFLPLLEKNSGVIIGFGSIATARGRTKNATYSAAKCALESYFESLLHFASKTSLHVQFYTPGYIDTNLAFSQKLPFPAADPRKLAKMAYRNQKRNGKFYFPSYWFFICHCLRLLPSIIFNRLDF